MTAPHVETLEEILAEYEGSGFSQEKAALRAAIALMRGQSDMVLMPREPTPLMLAHYRHVISGGDWQQNVFTLTKRQLARAKRAYAAMLAARPLPSPPAQSQEPMT